MNRLDERLACVASMVRPGSRLADIGTDHAYLPVWLVEQGICPFAIASDIGEGPLESARRTIENADLTSKILCRLGNGLATILPEEVEDIAIAGMGGETIAAILEAAPWVKNESLRLILQPMTRAEDLRRWLLGNGFTVEKERLIRDRHHLYPVMVATYTATYSDDDLAAYAGFFEAEEGRPYRQMMAKHLARRADGLCHSGQLDQAAQLRRLAEQLKMM